MHTTTALQNVEQALTEVDNVLFKVHLDHLGTMEVVRPDWDVENARMAIRLGRLHKLVYDPEEDNLDKLNSVLAAMHIQKSSVVICIDSDGRKTNLYLGVRDDASPTSAHAAMQTLQKALNANFPGFKKTALPNEDIARLSHTMRQADTIASLVGVPSLKDQEKRTFVQGLEKIIEGMSGQRYTALIIADPVPRQQLELVEASLHQLYSALSFMAENQITLSENESLALGQTLSKAVTETITDSIAQSQTLTQGASSSTAKGRTRSWSGAMTAGSAGIGGAIGSIFPGIGTALGAVIGGAVGGTVGGLIGSTTSTTTEGTTSSTANGTTKTQSKSKATTASEGSSETTTRGTGKSLQFTVKDRRLQEILAILDEQLERIRDCKNYGMWQWGAYFTGNSRPVVSMGAAIYSGILSGQSTGIERSAVTLWDKNDDPKRFAALMEYLAAFRHPVLQAPEELSFPMLMPCAMVSTRETAVGMSLPQKSLPGISVLEMTSFGRSVCRLENSAGSRDFRLGIVSHLDTAEADNPVKLDVDSLAAHTFITGSTGAGKSNTIYSLLHTLWTRHHIPFLVIEPAKGEYKDVAGGWEAVSVLGTNPFKMPLLRVNPFSFPEGIHVVEHIDRLVEILNAVWPMYAAMPAILKEAVELAYERMGWNLLESRSKFGRVFPDFHDLLEVLPGIIGSSRYSDEMKGNYTGALVTRIRSLTNGYYRSIFQKEEYTPNELFDRPCIIDLSRIGSTETKAMLMGVLFLKLQEHRMAQRSGTNSELQHITVMEEAHTLLRRTSFDQNQEGANLQGKSVEMIANSIAEMRTYGEGFIIADQAPGLLDPSVIRNTNTKIILRLPDWDDRQLVGKAANLDEDQLNELARLTTGCAAVYQNNWVEAVLCQCDLFNFSEKAKGFCYESPAAIQPDSRTFHRTAFAQVLAKARMTERDIESVANELEIDLHALAQYYPYLTEAIRNGKDDKEWLLYHLKDVLKFDEAAISINHADSFTRWTEQLLQNIGSNLDKNILCDGMDLALLCATFEILAKEKPEDSEIWLREMERAEHWKGAIL